MRFLKVQGSCFFQCCLIFKVRAVSLKRRRLSYHISFHLSRTNFEVFCDFLSRLARQSGESDYITLFSICQQQISFLCDFSSFAPLSRDSFAIIPPLDGNVNGFFKVFFVNLRFCKNCMVSGGVERVPRCRRLCTLYNFNIRVLKARALQHRRFFCCRFHPVHIICN